MATRISPAVEMPGNNPAQGSAGSINALKPLIMKKTAHEWVHIDSNFCIDKHRMTVMTRHFLTAVFHFGK
ncbi:hypothetical protein [Thiolapillus sp.]|uniref:hypothetical protein n=1 Tax=Thiolapillus sp. TaxID=2017437 RepID=UPI003AF95E09